jgi:hypothetical protein
VSISLSHTSLADMSPPTSVPSLRDGAFSFRCFVSSIGRAHSFEVLLLLLLLLLLGTAARTEKKESFACRLWRGNGRIVWTALRGGKVKLSGL